MFKKLNESVFEHLKEKKYFEFNDFLDNAICKDCWFYIFKGKKGIGKSFALNNIYLDIAKNGGNILYIRTRREDIQNFKNTNMMNLLLPFEFEGNKIVIKKEFAEQNKVEVRVCGMFAYANNLSSLRSMNYDNFKYIIYDEFVENQKSNYRNRDVFATNFMKFVMDVYRQTPELKVFLLGNNDLSYDPFTEYFGIDIQDSVFNIDKENGLFFANLGNYYIGMLKDKKSYGLAYYDERLRLFLEDNKNFEDLSLFENYSKKTNGIIEYYYYFEEHLFSFIRDLKNDVYYIDFEDKVVNGLPVFVFNQKDNILLTNATLLNEVQIWAETNKLSNLIKSRKLRFLTDFAKDEIINMIDSNYKSVI